MQETLGQYFCYCIYWETSAFDYFLIDRDIFCGNIRDFPWKYIFNLVAFALATELFWRAHVGIHFCINTFLYIKYVYTDSATALT